MKDCLDTVFNDSYAPEELVSLVSLRSTGCIVEEEPTTLGTSPGLKMELKVSRYQTY
jgi:hypothetical protein